MADGAQSVKLLCELAAQRGLRVDMHCDETDDPMSRHIETLAFHTQRLGLHGRVNGSHLTSMHSMDNYYVSKLIPLMAEARVSAVANPLINITIQGRHDTYPKRRGMTRVPELLAAGVPVAFGHDCVMDPWYSLGSGDMLEVAHMGLHVAQMTGQEAMRACFDAVTRDAGRAFSGLEGYGIAPGCHADLVLLQARDPVEAIRLRATRLAVIRRGRVIARTPATTATLQLPGRPETVSFQLRRFRSLDPGRAACQRGWRRVKDSVGFPRTLRNEEMTETIVRRAGEEGITPFWRRIPRFFLYPLSPQPLLFMLGLACVTLVARFIPLLAIPALLLTALAFSALLLLRAGSHRLRPALGDHLGRRSVRPVPALEAARRLAPVWRCWSA